MNKLKDHNYIVIQGWMCTELKGNELLIYALIYGFSQDGESTYSGGRKFIADTFNISLPTVDKALKSLTDNGYIEKIPMDINGVQFNHYKNSWGVVKKLSGGSKETFPYNINNNKNTNNCNSKELQLLEKTGKKFELSRQPILKKPSLYNSCVAVIDSFTQNPELRKSLINYLLYRLQVKEKPLYLNMWKGIINKLLGYTLNQQILMVQQSIDCGYLSFYELKKTKKQRNSEPVAGTGCLQDTEEDKVNRELFIQELQDKGKRTEF